MAWSQVETEVMLGQSGPPVHSWQPLSTSAPFPVTKGVRLWVGRLYHQSVMKDSRQRKPHDLQWKVSSGQVRLKGF